MKPLLLTVLVFLCVAGNATNYYFSSSLGDDNRSVTQAQNPSTPWKSIQKLNAIFTTLLPGDSVLFKRGDVFEGKLVPNKSGTAARPIVIGAYGAGNRPVISGLLPLKSFGVYSGNIWSHSLNADMPNVLLLNERQQTLGRYPNAGDANGGYLNFEAHATTTSITDNGLLTPNNWTGAELVLRKRRWVLDRSRITSNTSTTINYTSVSNYEPVNNYGYFFQNHLKTLDTDGEWSFDAAQKKLYLFKSYFSPSTADVKVSVTDTLLYINFKNFITVRDLQFKGANETAVMVTNAQNVTLTGCEMVHNGWNAVLLNNVADVLIENSQFRNNSNNAITTLYNCRNITIRNNAIRSTGIYAGMGKSGDLTYQAITLKGKNCLVEYNTIDSTGYVPIRFEGDSITIRNNVIRDFLWVKDDGGGIYSWNNNPNAVDNVYRVVKDNLVLNGIGAGAGTATPQEAYAHGIYMDDNSANVDITGNTVADCGESGLYIHNSHNITATGNTFYNNNRQVLLQHDNVSPTKPNRNITLRGNILYARQPSQFLLYLKSIKDDIAQFGTSDNNYFCSPFQQKPSIYTSFMRNGFELMQAYDLSSWQAAMKMDLASKPAPSQVAPYRSTSVSTTNKTLFNGGFDSDIKGIYSYVYTGAFRVQWSTGKLDGGSLQLVMDTVTSNRGYAIMNVGSVTAGKAYLLKFSLVGKSTNKSLRVYLRKTASPYTRISEVSFCKVLNTRTENEVLLVPGETVSGASLVVDVSDQNSLWLDNIGFHEAAITPVDPDDHLRFDHNASASGKTVALDDSYVDAKNLVYSGTLSLQPFTAAVLLKTTATARTTQTITFPAISNKTVGDPDFSLAATASSGLPVSYRVVAGPATVTGSTVTVTGAGTVTIEASQSGNAAYNAALPVSRSFSVVALTSAKLSQSIAFSPVSDKADGDAPFAVSATATSGLPVNYRIVSGPATIAGNVVTLTGAGTVTVEATQAGDATYNAAAPVTESFAVAAASSSSFAKQNQTISFGTLAYKTYSNPPFSLTATASSGLPVSYRVVSGPITISGNRMTITGVGTATIEASQAGNASFNAATPVARSFSIGKASQTITFPYLQDKRVGDLPFTLAATASSGLPVSYRVVSGPATISGSTLTLNGAGSVTLEATQSGNAYYNSAFAVNRTFEVEPGTLSIRSDRGDVAGLPLETTYAGEQNTLRIYPNPLAATGVIEITLAQAVTASVAIFDLQGRLVKNLGDRKFEKGQVQKISLAAQAFTNGTYIVRVAAQELVLTQKVVVLK